MEHPSELQQLQRPNQPGTSASGASGHSRVGGRMTSGSLGKPSPMIGEVGDSSSWYDQVTCKQAKKGACKRKRTDTEQLAPGHPFPLGPESDRKEAMDAIYEHVVSQELPQRNLASWAISAYYPYFTPPAAKTMVSQVLCMIAEYQGLYDHQPYRTRGSRAIPASTGGLCLSSWHGHYQCEGP